MGPGTYGSRRGRPKKGQALFDELKRTSVTRRAAKKPALKKVESPVKRTAGSAKKSTVKNFNAGVSKGGVSFNEAFRHFKNKGNKSFTWNNKKYTTETAKPTKIAKPTKTAKSTETAKPKNMPKKSNADSMRKRLMKRRYGLIHSSRTGR